MEIPDEAIFVKLKLPNGDLWMTKVDYVALYTKLQWIFANVEYHVAEPGDVELVDFVGIAKRITV